jgi:5'-nucleotidase
MSFPIRASCGGRLLLRILCAAALTMVAQPAFALRILVTNDDGFESRNLQALFTALKAAGHDVLMSAPYRNQSGVSAALGALFDFPATTTPSPGGVIASGAPGVGPTTLAADQYYVNGTPVAAVIHGIETLAPAKWGARPDIVISGPNAGHNLGTVTPHSGTVGAAITALNWGVPAIAVSGINEDAASAPLLA